MNALTILKVSISPKFEKQLFAIKSPEHIFCTVKLMFNDHHWGPNIAAVVDRWSFML